MMLGECGVLAEPALRLGAFVDGFATLALRHSPELPSAHIMRPVANSESLQFSKS